MSADSRRGRRHRAQHPRIGEVLVRSFRHLRRRVVAGLRHHIPYASEHAGHSPTAARYVDVRWHPTRPIPLRDLPEGQRRPGPSAAIGLSTTGLAAARLSRPCRYPGLWYWWARASIVVPTNTDLPLARRRSGSARSMSLCSIGRMAWRCPWAPGLRRMSRRRKAPPWARP